MFQAQGMADWIPQYITNIRLSVNYRRADGRGSTNSRIRADNDQVSKPLVRRAGSTRDRTQHRDLIEPGPLSVRLLYRLKHVSSGSLVVPLVLYPDHVCMSTGIFHNGLWRLPPHLSSVLSILTSVSRTRVFLRSCCL